jgi:hypothetical protein
LSQIEGKFGTPNRSLGFVVIVDIIVLILTQIKIEKDKLPNEYDNVIYYESK